MKKYRILYKKYGTDSICIFDTVAETSEDANNKFFENNNGMILRTDFVDWV